VHRFIEGLGNGVEFLHECRQNKGNSILRSGMERVLSMLVMFRHQILRDLSLNSNWSEETGKSFVGFTWQRVVTPRGQEVSGDTSAVEEGNALKGKIP
jgi:hypothetical protein